MLKFHKNLQTHHKLVVTLLVLIGLSAPIHFALPIISAVTNTVKTTAIKTNIQNCSNLSMQESYAKLPMSFELNVGQQNPEVKYLSRGKGYTVFITGKEIVLSMSSNKYKREEPELMTEPYSTKVLSEYAKFSKTELIDYRKLENRQNLETLRMCWIGANTSITSTELLSGKTNYFIGQDSTKWKTNIPTFGKVKYAEIYNGIDLELYGTQQNLEYDCHVQPGANPDQIRVKFEGAKQVEINDQGDLLLHLNTGIVKQAKAFVYQEQEGKKNPISVQYVLKENGEISFKYGKYNQSKELIIDPVLSYSDFIGGTMSSNEAGNDIAVDKDGNVYVVGYTNATDFPTTLESYDTKGTGDFDIFVTKLDSSGSRLIYSTFFGSENNAENAIGIAVSDVGEAFVTGFTGAPSFPTTPGAYDTTHNGGEDVFVTKLSSDGNKLIYSTLLGGGNADSANGIAISQTGEAFIAGLTYSPNFPVTSGAYDTTYNEGEDAFVAKLNNTGSELIYSTLLGGTSDEAANSIAISKEGETFVTGFTLSSNTNFQTTSNAYDITHNGGRDVFVTKLNTTGSNLVYSTFLGSKDEDIGYKVIVSNEDEAFITGATTGMGFPITPNAYDTTHNGNADIFVTKLNRDGNKLIYSTFVGGTNTEWGIGMAVSKTGEAFITGLTYITNGESTSTFPTTSEAYDTSYNGKADAFVIKLDNSGSKLIYSTFIGGDNNDFGYGIAVSDTGETFITGGTQDSNIDFPTTPNSYDSTHNGQRDVFVTKLNNTGDKLIYSTLLGGANGPAEDIAVSVAVDKLGSAYITGSTESPRFPISSDGYDKTQSGDEDVFVMKLNNTGDAIVYSTFLGGKGSDHGVGIAISDFGEAFITGNTNDEFPTTLNAYDTTYNGGVDAFVTKLNITGDQLIYSTFLGGKELDGGNDITISNVGEAYITGLTIEENNESNFPTTQSVYSTKHNGGIYDAFVSKFDSTGASLIYSTFLGGSSRDQGISIDINQTGEAFVTGTTEKGFEKDFPTTSGAYNTKHNGSLDAFVTKLSKDGSKLIYSTFLGGVGIDYGVQIVVSKQGEVFVTGFTNGEVDSKNGNFPTTSKAYDTTYNGSTDVFVSKLNKTGSKLIYSTFLGGNGDDLGIGLSVCETGEVFVTGTSDSSTFPITPDAYNKTFNGMTDIFVAKLDVTGEKLIYSTFLGGSKDDFANGIAIGNDGALYIVGTTSSPNFSTTGFGIRDGFNAFIAKFVVGS